MVEAILNNKIRVKEDKEIQRSNHQICRMYSYLKQENG